MKQRLTKAAAGREVGVSRVRIQQLINTGALRCGEDGKIDPDDLAACRKTQITKNPKKVLFNQPTNGKEIFPSGMSKMMGLDSEGWPLLEGSETVSELGDRAHQSSMTDALAANLRISAMREQKLRGELDQMEFKRRRERGDFLERKIVEDSGHEAMKIVASLLQNLPTEIAAIFADPETKAQVRTKVQERVDQMQHAMHKSLINLVQTDA